jgi:CRP-like cAMP-binding protein
MHEQPRFQAELIDILAGELADARRHLALLNRRSALEKVAAFIVDHFRRAGSSGQVELQVSRNDMADFLGLTIETVSRTLTKLRNQYVIDIPQTQSIRILDIGRMEELADGNFDSERTTKLLKAG